NDEDLDLRPETIPNFKVKPDDMSYTELKMFATEVKKNGGDPNRWLVDLNFKLSIPFANFIMVLFGAPIASSRKHSNAIFGFIISLMSAFIYYGLNTMIKTIGHNGQLPPVSSAWLTNVLFLIGGVVILFTARK
ncbi:LptF/LptG family permease, partial [bacterium]|nr:LptF/LptG family permease [bacterium]